MVLIFESPKDSNSKDGVKSRSITITESLKF